MARKAPKRSPAGSLLITCEHGGNLIPHEWDHLFKMHRRVLDSHRGWDPGAIELAGLLAASMQAPMRFGLVSRLVVDLNRSINHPDLFSEFMASVGPRERAAILKRHYFPYRQDVERTVARMCETGPVVHLSIHTFTPVFHGRRRTVDIGLLYDPGRKLESTLVSDLERDLKAGLPRLRIRRNTPYKGTDDGLTTHLRGMRPDDRYAGIELEVNQRLVRAGTARWRAIVDRIVRSISAAGLSPLAAHQAELRPQ